MFNDYPHTDLHELNLDWIIKKVKELSAQWAQTSQAWTDTQAAWEDMKAYINNYFDNLDVQQEINVKLADMAESGELSTLISPFVASGLPDVVALQLPAVVSLQIGGVVAEQIPFVVQAQLPAVVATYAAGQVAAWLSEHVNPETGYVIDDTLTISGAAADAAVVGEKIGELKSALSAIDEQVNVALSPSVVEGEKVNAPDASNAKPLGLIAYVNPIVAGSGTPTDINPRAISANTECVIYNAKSLSDVPTTLTVDLTDGDSIYKGYVDVMNKKVVATHKLVTFLWSEMGGQSDRGNNFVSRAKLLSDIKISEKLDSICNIAIYRSDNTGNSHFYIQENKYVLVFAPNTMSESTTIQILYPIDPISYDIAISPSYVLTDGNNYFWNSTGNTVLTYIPINIVDYVPYFENLLNVSDISHNTVISSTGAESEDTTRFTTGFIPVKKGDIIYSGFNGFYYVLDRIQVYNSQKQVLATSYTITYGVYVVTQDNAAYVRLGSKYAFGNYNYFQVQTMPFRGWLPFGKKEYPIAPRRKVVNIRKDGVGGYTSIRQAFETEGDNCVYQIWNGTYNVEEDFTAEEIASASYDGDHTGFTGLVVPRNSKIIGMGFKRDDIVISCTISDDYTSTARQAISTLNLIGSCEIENVTVVANNIRVAIHDDYRLASGEYHTIKNCNLINNRAGTDNNGYGLGLRQGLTVTMEDVYMSAGIIVHGQNSAYAKSKIVMKDCTVDGRISINNVNTGNVLYGNEIVLDNVYYTSLVIASSVDTAYAIVYLNSCCENPIIFSDKIIPIHGANYPKLFAYSGVSKGNAVKYVTEKTVQTSSDLDYVVGVAMNDASADEYVTVAEFRKYIGTNVLGIASCNIGDKIGYSDGAFVVDSNGTFGEVIYKYSSVGVVKIR